MSEYDPDLVERVAEALHDADPVPSDEGWPCVAADEHRASARAALAAVAIDLIAKGAAEGYYRAVGAERRGAVAALREAADGLRRTGELRERLTPWLTAEGPADIKARAVCGVVHDWLNEAADRREGDDDD